MPTKKYKIRYLPIFDRDLCEIVYYISYVLENPDAANDLIDAIEDAINKRSHSPTSFLPFSSLKKRTTKYYRIRVKNYIIFYTVIGEYMEIRRIFYSRRDIEHFLD